MDTQTKNFNDAMLELDMFINRLSASETKRSLKSIASGLRHFGLQLQMGRIGGKPIDLLKLALRHCGEERVPLQDVSDLINAHQRGHAGPVAKAVGDGT